ncbi:MAG: glycosyltransferase family 39 protein [Candidatus Sumerlaeia bacterium]|nr:glycosyltransferase family 39 protein [Candidatus Sumerlaeia bacterium]
MTLLLPVVFLLLTWSILARSRTQKQDRPSGDRWGEGLLAATVVAGLCVAASTEALSGFKALGRIPLAIFWSVAIAAVVAVGWKVGFARPTLRALTLPASFGWFEKTAAVLMILLATVLGVVALLAVPNTYDSLSYHLARVAHWEQNRSIAFYPTSILRQNHPPPFAEWCLLQTRLLSGSYQWVNLVQWAAMTVSLVGVARIAGHLGAETWGQWTAAIFAATLPMGIFQATSTQNDYVAGLWLAAFVFFGLQAIERPTLRHLILMSGALALGLLTKGTVYLFAFPFCVWFAIALARRMGGSVWRAAAIAAGLILLVNGGHYIRNYRLFGSPLGPGREASDNDVYIYRNEAYGIRPLLSNAVRNLTLHLSAPWPAWNQAVYRAAVGIHRAIGANPDDPRTTWLHEKYRVAFRHDENFGGNPLHTVLFGAALAVFLYACARRKSATARPALVYTACLAGAALLFCLLLRWQPWHGRLHLPLFLAAAPVFGRIVAQPAVWKWLGRPAVALMLIAAFPTAALHRARPVFGGNSVFLGPKHEKIVRNYPLEVFLPALQFIGENRCRHVGLLLYGDAPEFSIWFAQEIIGDWPVRFEHVGVRNPSRALAPPVYPPHILSVGYAPERVLILNGKRYTLIYSEGAVNGYRAEQ